MIFDKSLSSGLSTIKGSLNTETVAFRRLLLWPGMEQRMKISHDFTDFIYLRLPKMLENSVAQISGDWECAECQSQIDLLAMPSCYILLSGPFQPIWPHRRASCTSWWLSDQSSMSFPVAPVKSSPPLASDTVLSPDVGCFLVDMWKHQQKSTCFDVSWDIQHVFSGACFFRLLL